MLPRRDAGAPADELKLVDVRDAGTSDALDLVDPVAEAHPVGSTDLFRVRNARLIAQRQAAAEMDKCGNALGLSPAARSRIVSPEAFDDDPLAMLLASGWGRDDPRQCQNSKSLAVS